MSERRMTICPLLTSSAHGSFAKKRSASATADVPSLESAIRTEEAAPEGYGVNRRPYRNEHIICHYMNSPPKQHDSTHQHSAS